MTRAARLRRAAVALVAVVACTDVVAGVTYLVSPDRVEHGTPSARQPLPAPSTSSPSPSPSPSSSPAPIVQHATPNTVWIPVQHVRAPIDVCDIVNNELEPPQNVHHTCYWAGGAALSAKTGTTVVTGHINWVGQGTGALGNIGELHRGNIVRTTGKDGVVTTWEVQTVVHRPKSNGIDTSVFVGADGPRKLYLITCGGAFDSADANYLDNIYVEAVPLQGLSAAPTD
ncbi:MAG TPA: class F sortase [Jatrophihabitantaceae bacterium]|nr:class F sortase [Jatrophihabitantaceae bacterium]